MNYINKILGTGALFTLLVAPLHANKCETQLFTTTLNSALTVGDVIENLADACELSLIVRDQEAKKKLSEKLYYVSLNNASLDEFLDTVLTENDISYVLEDNKLRISYLNTKTFRLHYISGDRVGKSNAHVTIANASKSDAGGQSGGKDGAGSNGSKTGVSIESHDEFKFWSKIEKEIHQLVNRPEDTYESPTPVVNAEAGMITVTGTAKQLERVSIYIDALTKQLKSQVLIDVKILSVTFDDSYTTGVDWSQLYNFQNMAIASASMLQNNVSSLTSATDGELSIGDITSAPNTEPKSSGAIITRSSVQITDVIKFLKTQGDVRSISNPKILTLNNQPALISVGNELFYKIQSTSILQGSSGAGTQQSGETIDSVFAGILLDITPEIAEDGSIALKINPSISDTIDTVSRDNSGARNIPPDLSRKQISSVVTLQDGQHVILGGLISSKTGTKVSKVPLLGDLPLLEYLFKREVRVDSVDELVLIITPHIIKRDTELSLENFGYKKLSYD